MHKETRSELEYWLAFYFSKGIGFQTVQNLLEQFTLDEIFSFTHFDQLKTGFNSNALKNLKNTNWQKITSLISDCESSDIKIIYFSHPKYPQLLKEIASPPLVLFCKGDIELLNTPKLAIVGSRNATEIGRQVSKDIATNLALNDFCVVSGMARGIDSCAHQGALQVGRNTIAVLGTGVDVCYPKRAKELYHQIAEKGLIISEYLPGTSALAANFPRRNRIISGLSLGTIVVEAEQKSGSLITAKYALEQNREIFAVPGSVYNELAKGCHALIKQGAKLIENCEDIFAELSVLPKSCLYKVEETEKPVMSDPVLKHLNEEVTSVDKLQQLSQLPIDELLSQLLDLELSGQVIRVLDGYTRIGRS
ncbi:DNA-processing protein DprA [Pseudoalteromonas sp. SSM20]|uniref:DNA-processing protein DprA n=1 Tax=Pseudoalteromonas sp. SSM20 TaxID=3139394 RepID=UPI003BA99E60